jgi:Membrane domain of glycerophosphoryl diester phosphodiesterase
MSTQLYPPRRAQSIPEVLDTTFKLFSISLVKVLPYGMLGTLAGQLGNIYNLTTGRPARQFLPRDPTAWLVLAISVALSMALWAAMLLRQRAISQGTPVSMQAELRRVARRLPALLGFLVLQLIAVGAGFVLLIIPGVYIGVALSMTVPALVLEDEALIEAMKLSLRLMKDNWWRTFATFLVTFIIVCVFYLLGGIFAAIVTQFERGADVAIVTATSTVVVISLGAVSSPFFAAMTLAVFGNLQTRAAPVAAVA